MSGAALPAPSPCSATAGQGQGAPVVFFNETRPRELYGSGFTGVVPPCLLSWRFATADCGASP